MKDTLSSVGTDISHKTVAALFQPPLMGQFCGNHKELSQYGTILQCQISHRCDMTSWDEQNMIGRLWVDVCKGDHIFILVYNVTWYLTLCDFAKQAVFHIQNIPHMRCAMGAIYRAH